MNELFRRSLKESGAGAANLMALFGADSDDPDAWAGAVMLADLIRVIRMAVFGKKDV